MTDSAVNNSHDVPSSPSGASENGGKQSKLRFSKVSISVVVLSLLILLIICMAAIIGYAVFFTDTISYMRGDIITADGDTDGIDEEKDEEDEDDEDQGDLDESDLDDRSLGGSVEYPEYTLDLGDRGEITVPEGWYVSRFTSDYEISPTDLTSELPVAFSFGRYPIHQLTLIELTNGSSTITMSSSESMIMGGYGANYSELEPGYTVFLEPGSGDPDRAGGARKADGLRYEYEVIIRCDDPVICGDYVVLHGEVPYNTFSYTGSTRYLTIADSLFVEAFVDGGFLPI